MFYANTCGSGSGGGGGGGEAERDCGITLPRAEEKKNKKKKKKREEEVEGENRWTWIGHRHAWIELKDERNLCSCATTENKGRMRAAGRGNQAKEKIERKRNGNKGRLHIYG